MYYKAILLSIIVASSSFGKCIVTNDEASAIQSKSIVIAIFVKNTLSDSKIKKLKQVERGFRYKSIFTVETSIKGTLKKGKTVKIARIFTKATRNFSYPPNLEKNKPYLLILPDKELSDGSIYGAINGSCGRIRIKAVTQYDTTEDYIKKYSREKYNR